MISNDSLPSIISTVNSVIQSFYYSKDQPSLIEKNSDECALFKYYKDDVSFYFDISPLVVEIKIIAFKEVIFYDFFYPLNKKIYIINSDYRIFNQNNIFLLNDWIINHNFIF